MLDTRARCVNALSSGSAYLALQVLHIIAPVVLWLTLKREAWAMMRGELASTHQ